MFVVLLQGSQMMSDMMKLIIVSLGATLLRNIQKEPEHDVLFVQTIPTLSAPNVKFTCIASVLEHFMERIEFRYGVWTKV